ncbi:motility regulator [Glaciecola sp. KUL10]|nr:motility regulator [Glaciecola sp. KUL10]
MYLAKQQGKNQYELFDKRLNVEYKKRSFLASQLKRGINQGAFKFNYLPIARLNGKGLLGVDAILRFKDVNEQELLPEAFMPLLLQIGEMLAVVEWMLDETCKKLSIVGRDASVNDPFSISLSLPVNVLLLEELPSMIQ